MPSVNFTPDPVPRLEASFLRVFANNMEKIRQAFLRAQPSGQFGTDTQSVVSVSQTGPHSVTFPVAFSTTPNIQVTVNMFSVFPIVLITARSTTGFTYFLKFDAVHTGTFNAMWAAFEVT